MNRFSRARVLDVLRGGSIVGPLLVRPFTSAGCGYALAGRGSFLPTDIRVVAIPPLVNRTTFFDVEQILTEKVRNEFIGRGKYKIVTDPAGADAVLNAEITSITLQPVGLTSTQLASRY